MKNKIRYLRKKILLETKNNSELNWQIESIDKKYNLFIEKNKNQLLKEFLEREKTKN